jgi:hypothetical protein
MSENKKSFIAYTDWGDTFKALPDDKAGQLIKHLFAYVNDENPVSEDVLINAVFANIKQTLKRDLDKYKAIISRNRENGSKGGRPKLAVKKPRKPSGISRIPNNPEEPSINPSEPKKADSDNDSVIDSVEKRKEEFALLVLECSEKYPKTMVADFISYWAEKNKTASKMRFEMEKVFEIPRRLSTWASKDKTFNQNKFNPQPIQQPQSITVTNGQDYK